MNIPNALLNLLHRKQDGDGQVSVKIFSIRYNWTINQDKILPDMDNNTRKFYPCR